MRRMRHLKPREIQGCQLALDASIPTSLYDATSGGSLVGADGQVARWEDQSGHARHVTQATSGERPLRRVASMGGLDALEFDGANDDLIRASTDVSAFYDSGTDTSILAVQAQDGAKSENVTLYIDAAAKTLGLLATFADVIYFDAGSLSSSGRMSVAQPFGWDGVNHTLFCTRLGANGYISANNNTLATKSDFSETVSSGTATLHIGSYVDLFNFDGKITEVAIWARGLNDAVSRRVWQSRQRKWRIAG